MVTLKVWLPTWAVRVSWPSGACGAGVTVPANAPNASRCSTAAYTTWPVALVNVTRTGVPCIQDAVRAGMAGGDEPTIGGAHDAHEQPRQWPPAVQISGPDERPVGRRLEGESGPRDHEGDLVAAAGGAGRAQDVEAG